MRLDFNVLWIDDHPEHVRRQKERVRKHMLEHGFALRLVEETSFGAAGRHLSTDVLRDQIDMVVVDFDLGAGSGGEKVIGEVRQHAPFKDIVFYSGVAERLQEEVSKGAWDGIYCSPRDYVEETVNGAFDALVKKVLDLDHVRGIVLGATSDIDHLLHDWLVMLAGRLPDTQQARILKYVEEHLQERAEALAKQLEGLRASPLTESVLRKREGLDASFKIRLVCKMIEAASPGGHKELLDQLRAYFGEIPKHRNSLAHTRMVVRGSVRTVAGEGQEVSLEVLTELRKKLIVYRDGFETLGRRLLGE